MSQTVSKNRAANELRENARAVMARIQDTTKPMTADEFTAAKAEFDALTARAQFLAEHTPEAEIERQGGDGSLVRMASAEGGEQLPATKQEQVDALRKAIRSAFGGTMAYCRAARGQMPHMTAKQEAVLKSAAELTRTIVGTGSDPSGGEFLLPLEQEQSIFRVDNSVPGLLQRARLYSMRGRTKRIPYAVQTTETITRPLSGISAVNIIGEGSLKDTREPAFAQRVLTAYKYAAIAEIADEEYEDDMTGDLEPTLVQLVGGEIMNQLNNHITISGTGSSQPTGALYTSQTALLKITRQTQNRIVFADAVNMYTQHTHGPNSFWIISRRALGELFTFEVSTGSGATYLANLNTDPANSRLLGYPIVVSDYLNTLGTEGDFGLINPDHYAAALRKQLTVESSIHVKFTYDITTWRFLARGGGIPIPDAPYAYRAVASANVDEHSPFVVLDDVYV